MYLSQKPRKLETPPPPPQPPSPPSTALKEFLASKSNVLKALCIFFINNNINYKIITLDLDFPAV